MFGRLLKLSVVAAALLAVAFALLFVFCLLQRVFESGRGRPLG
jgi:hypothetical protein